MSGLEAARLTSLAIFHLSAKTTAPAQATRAVVVENPGTYLGPSDLGQINDP
jgi:hypothetical protein